MFGEKIKLLRKNKKMTQTEIAKVLRISNGTIAMWETNKRQPDLEMVSRIAEYFGVTTDYLLGRDVKQIIIPGSLNDIPVAFAGGISDLTQDDIDDVARYVEFIRAKKIKK